MANFEASLPWVLRHEGGFSDHPADKGGRTNHGITQATLDAWNHTQADLGFPADVRDLLASQAGQIYKAKYWRFDDVTSQKIATKVFDMTVNMGLKQAVRLLQRALNAMGAALEEDGGFGPQTLWALNAADGCALMAGLISQCCAFYRHLANNDESQAVFLRGWLNRATEVPNA